MEVIHTDRAPKAIGPYSQAVRAGDFIYLAGQVGLNPETMQLAGDDFVAQARQAFENVLAIVQAANCNVSQIVKVTVYLTDMANFDELNETMKAYFYPPYPARAGVAVKTLPKNALVEIDAIVYAG